jgi:urease accessory protein
MRSSATAAALFAVTLAGCGAAFAHTLTGGGLEQGPSFAAGFRHPLSGVDHVLGMVAVGLWAGLNGRRALLIWPLVSLGMLMLGGTLGLASVPLYASEAGIVASLIVLGLLVLARVRPPVWAGATLISLFALAHGHAHGAEMPLAAAAATYAAGFLLASGALIGVGVAIASVGANRRRMVGGAGALIALAGVLLAAA